MSHSCVTAVNFPALVDNRASLARIQYRIGRYSDFRAAMMRALDRAPLLRDWSYRLPDDPGIALLEGAAILGDILTFYQELYANEAWLRTATWPQSIAALARLVGYRAAPGLGGSGHVAFEITGDSPVTVPAGFPFSAQIAGMDAPADFETAASLLALPALSRLSLYAPSSPAKISTHANRLAVRALDLAAVGITLKMNDRLMLVDDSLHTNRQIVVITNVAQVLDQTVVTLAGGWQGTDPSAGVTAYKLGRTFRAFGYNAPVTEVTLDGVNPPHATPVDTKMTFAAALEGFPLERQVNDLSAGITMLVDAPVTSQGGRYHYFASRTALTVNSSADEVGPLVGGVTRVAFDTPATVAASMPPILGTPYANRRTAVCHEVIGRAFAIAGVRVVEAGSIVDALDCLVDGNTYEAMNGRVVQFAAVQPDDTAARVEEGTVGIDRSQIGAASEVSVRRLSLTAALTQFTRTDFPLAAAGIVAFGNVAPMTQGKTQAVATLGNGDARQIFQTFELPKAPLTWLLDEALTPPREPQMQILVNQIEWTQVDSLFASAAQDQVYILREDDAGNTWVQFGNGINGATLPSGVGNVTATYRTGNAANGWRQSGAKPQANARVENLGQLWLYDEVTGGTADDDGEHVRQSAAGRVEELGRIVSLSDFEYEALNLGVEKALAVWDTDANVPLLKLTVLLSDATPAELASVQAAISKANADRGANRFAVLVLEASLEYVYLAAMIGVTAGYQFDLVQLAVASALGVLPTDGSAAPTGGVFSVDQRSLGEHEYASRIEAAIQNVPGVAWAEVTALGLLGSASDPARLDVPAPTALAASLACASDRLLALYAAQFVPSMGDA